MRTTARVGMRGFISWAFVLFVGCNQNQAPPPAVPGPTTSHPVTSKPAAPDSDATQAQSGATAWDAVAYRTAINESLEAWLAASPTFATKEGEHRFDDQWPDISEPAQAKLAADFRARAEGLRKIAPSLPAEADVAVAGTDRPAVDAQILADRLESIAYELDTMRFFERDPSRVLGLIGIGVTGLVDHDYAPKHTRMNALATRIARIPELLKTARARLKSPSRAALENTAIVAKGMSGMMRGPAVAEWVKWAEMPAASTGSAGKGREDVPLEQRLKKGAADAAAAIDAYAADVTKSFPIASAKDEPIGLEKWATMARLGEGVIESPAEVRKMGEAELVKLHAELDALIAQVGKKGESRAAFLARLEEDQPKIDKVLDDYRAANKGVEEWMRSHPFVTVPWDRAKLEIVQSPPHMRGVSLASMNVAGPLEPSVSDARFEVNIPEASMPAEKQKALLKFHAHGAIEMVSVHEAIPGHYLQFLFVRDVPSKVRKLTGSSTLIEGWAHYCELAAREAGYTGGDEARTHAFYLRMALQRAARVVVDVAENEGSMSVADGAKFLADNALIAPETAKIEARRAVVGPANMFSYMYGKLAILKLRDEVKAREKEKFDLVKFHDRLLAVGLVPIKYVGPLAFGTREGGTK
jgi:uncharacterized protein (DUF885 family)